MGEHKADLDAIFGRWKDLQKAAKVSADGKNLDEANRLRDDAWRLIKTIPAESKPALIDLLLSALADGDAGIRWGAARSLGQLRPLSPNAAAPLLKALSDSDFSVSVAAIIPLMAQGVLSRTDLPKISVVLKSGADIQRANAARVAKTLGANALEILPDLLHGLKDSNAMVRASCLDAIASIGPGAKDAASLIAGLLGETEETAVRQSAAKALGMLEVADDVVIQALDKALRDQSYLVRLRAAQSLGCLGPRSRIVVPALIKMLDDDDNWVRWAAAKTLIKVGSWQGFFAVQRYYMRIRSDQFFQKLKRGLSIRRWLIALQKRENYYFRTEPKGETLDALLRLAVKSCHASCWTVIGLRGEEDSTQPHVLEQLEFLKPFEPLFIRKWEYFELPEVFGSEIKKRRLAGVYVYRFNIEFVIELRQRVGELYHYGVMGRGLRPPEDLRLLRDENYDNPWLISTSHERQGCLVLSQNERKQIKDNHPEIDAILGGSVPEVVRESAERFTQGLRR